MTNSINNVEQTNTTDGYVILKYRNEQGEVTSEVKMKILESVEIENPTPAVTVEGRLENIEATVAYNQLQTEYLVILAEFNAM